MLEYMTENVTLQQWMLWLLMMGSVFNLVTVVSLAMQNKRLIKYCQKITNDYWNYINVSNN